MRIIAFLSLALLPIGIIAVQQTSQLDREARQRSEASLLSMTERSASGERTVIQRAFGAAEALAVLLQLIKDDRGACTEYLKDYLEGTSGYSFVGMIAPSGLSFCSSADEVLNFANAPGMTQLMAEPRTTVEVNLDPPAGGEPVVMAMEPVFGPAGFEGYIAVAVPYSVIMTEPDLRFTEDSLALITFNVSGEVLTAEKGLIGAAERLPAGRDLASLAKLGNFAFSGLDKAGRERVFAVVPVVGEAVYAIGSWDSEVPIDDGLRLASLLPLVMWLASVVVAYLALHRLVVRHIHGLSAKMRRFAVDRRMPEPSDSSDMSAELILIENDFLNMADAILRDEAQLENAVREKNILLKEVHHRVKNNLQLISSIMNMQMRKSASPETRAVVRRLQDRVLGLATIHRNLYKNENLTQVNAGKILREILNQITAASQDNDKPFDLVTQIDDVQLYPDQAVPLSMLVSEAITNAQKFMPAEGAQLTLRFVKLQGNRVRLEIINTLGGTPAADGAEPMGLGTQLIRAFAIQLEAQLALEQSEGNYTLSAEFDVKDFTPEPMDY